MVGEYVLKKSNPDRRPLVPSVGEHENVNPDEPKYMLSIGDVRPVVHKAQG